MEKRGNPPPYATYSQGGPTSSPYPNQQPQTTVIIGAPQPGGAFIVGAQSQYGPSSQNAYCAHCQTQILTKVQAETAARTHLYALLFCAVLLWPCICLPYCMDTCKNKNHYCPECGAYLGTYMN